MLREITYQVNRQSSNHQEGAGQRTIPAATCDGQPCRGYATSAVAPGCWPLLAHQRAGRPGRRTIGSPPSWTLRRWADVALWRAIDAARTARSSPGR